MNTALHDDGVILVIGASMLTGAGMSTMGSMLLSMSPIHIP
ncbi:hypothetical protein [Corynebacterium diphtheriae]|nr:hypothetical protein [Corynebacterium diphtheriae]